MNGVFYALIIAGCISAFVLLTFVVWRVVDLVGPEATPIDVEVDDA